MLLAVLPPLLVLGWRAWDHRWMADDGFIYLRVVRMIEAGHGPVFNASERVEIATSPLWTWMLVVGDLVLPLRLEWVAVCLGFVLTLTGLVLLMRGSAQLWRTSLRPGSVRSWFVPGAALVLAVLPPVWDFATSGMEGGLTFAWIGAVAWTIGQWASAPDGALSRRHAMLLGLGPLVRPDLSVISAVALLFVLATRWRTDGWQDRARLLGVAFALPLAYQIFRMGYYASLVPNTALAKSAARTRWEAGWFYLTDLASTYWLVVPLGLLSAMAVVLLRTAATGWTLQRCAGWLVLPLSGVAHALYVTRIGGDYLHGRLLLPALWALVAPLALVPVPVFGLGLRTIRWGAAAVAVWAVACGFWLRHPGHTEGAGIWIEDAPRGAAGNAGPKLVEHPVRVDQQGFEPPPSDVMPIPVTAEGIALPASPPAGLELPTTAMYGVGSVGYALGPSHHVLDLLALGDPLNSRLHVTAPREPGHEKTMPQAWLVARLSTRSLERQLLPAPHPIIGSLYESPDGLFERDVAAARATLACSPLQDVVDAVRKPLTPGRFVANVLAAPRLTRLKIPPAPVEAHAKLC